MSNEKTITTNQNSAPSAPREAGQQHVSNNISVDCDVIHSYTRKQAIEDGFLVDLMQNELGEVCRQHYKHPIVCTLPVFEIMQKAVDNEKYCNDYAGILHDMLYMSRVQYQFLATCPLDDYLEQA